jgi:hypothetical protein
MATTENTLNDGLARLMTIGTWVGCSLMALGLSFATLGIHFSISAASVIMAGVAMIALLPALRVVSMGVWFFARRDTQFALIALAVLLIIAASTCLGLAAA